MMKEPEKNPIPDWHPLLSTLMKRKPTVNASLISVRATHPNPEESYRAGTAIPKTHPSVHALLKAFIPTTHPNIDENLQDPKKYPLPGWHPQLTMFQSRRQDCKDNDEYFNRATKFRCVKQPACKNANGTLYLKSPAIDKAGVCAVCTNAVCRSTHYRDGFCGGLANRFTCHACANIQCSEPNQYRVADPPCTVVNKAFTCAYCTNIKCRTDQVRVGKCAGTENGFKCKPCSNIACNWATQYRVGSCSGTSDGYVCRSHPVCNYPSQFLDDSRGFFDLKRRAGVCTDHPICSGEKSLLGATNRTRGVCSTCLSGMYANAQTGGKCKLCSSVPAFSCRLDQYQTGRCVGNVQTYACHDCTKPTCDPTAYLTGRCGVRTNNYKCLSQPTCNKNQYLQGATSASKGTCRFCDNDRCREEGMYRAGVCEGRVNGFQCRMQPRCPDGQFLAGGTSTRKGSCVKCSRSSCPVGKYRAGECQGESDGYTCQDHPTCQTDWYLTGWCQLQTDH